MVAILSITAALAAVVLPNIVSATGLDQAAVAKGLLYFGTATDNPELTDIPYLTQLNNTADFGQITPGNSQKWDTTEPSQGTFSFTKGDVIADLAEQNGQYLRCHTLVWYNQLPSWVTSGTWTNATLIAALQNHITNVVKHYKGRCLHWDVVNEALNDDGTYRTNIFYTTIGEAYIPIAFAAAAAADPDAKLFYNDYNLEYGGNKAASARAIVQLVQKAGVKIDGVGLQAHFSVGTVPSKSSLVSVLQGFTALGVEVAYTEADVRIQLPTTATTLAQQAKDFQALVQSCVETTGCVGFTIWDWTDKYSWVPSTFSGYGAALPWDENLVKKPAYDGLLAGMGVTVTATATATATATSTATTGAATSTGTGATAAHYGQCGGGSWTGPTVCASPWTCTYVNDWYSQCL
ncbi:putative endo-1,4-beta-xylanase [Aspergillus homomorphus CBS 101889]|uniref:Beta-xylanase n=1 Tax=Aspergillus homomorphus (strain CBS 101889) TaxID=1450537 RepID=A0A395I7Y7_ASPHC|nr:putative endo-1,4-beta-xylanase [Aspergillus homomorphus CBS 101889]RAL15178.1 putative endo-1,4-beta-xylanase [Aspergillus homomorphus CBS 101889]